jgi:hypothetical protein
MNKQCVTFEMAKKLKKLGFNKKCYHVYERDGRFVEFMYLKVYLGDDDIMELLSRDSAWEIKLNNPNYFPAPLWQQVIDWLREEHHIYINTSVGIGEDQITVSVTDNSVARDTYAHTFRIPIDVQDYYRAREMAIEKALDLVQ